MVNPREDPLVGETVGNYRLNAVIAEGGWGCVYDATHTKIGRRAAVKVLHPSVAQGAIEVSRFQTEARLVNEIGHPNIVDVVDFIELEDPPIIGLVMEYIAGPTLTSVIRKPGLSVEHSTEVVLEIAETMRAVHKVGVIHRDLKPSNIMFTAAVTKDMLRLPSMKLLDFGVAKSPDAQHRTVVGSVLGSPQYMAPEQIMSETITPAADIYALGEIYYEALRGRRLFRGHRQACLAAKHSGLIPPMDLPPGTPTDATQLIIDTLARDPNDRPSLEDVIERLKAILHHLEDKAEITFTDGDLKDFGLQRERNSTVRARPLVESTAVVQMPRRSSAGWIFGAVAILIAAAAAVFAGLSLSDKTEPTVLPAKVPAKRRAVPTRVPPVEIAVPDEEPPAGEAPADENSEPTREPTRRVRARRKPTAETPKAAVPETTPSQAGKTKAAVPEVVEAEDPAGTESVIQLEDAPDDDRPLRRRKKRKKKPKAATDSAPSKTDDTEAAKAEPGELDRAAEPDKADKDVSDKPTPKDDSADKPKESPKKQPESKKEDKPAKKPAAKPKAPETPPTAVPEKELKPW